MKPPFQEITAFEDATRDFEALYALLTSWFDPTTGKGLFLQLPASGQRIVTFGLLTGFNALANSNTGYNLGAPAAFGFTTQVDAVICAAFPASTFTGFFTVVGVAANGPYTGGSPPQIQVANGATAQAFSVNYVALGH